MKPFLNTDFADICPELLSFRNDQTGSPRFFGCDGGPNTLLANHGVAKKKTSKPLPPCPKGCTNGYVTPMTNLSKCNIAEVLLLAGWIERSTKGPFLCERDALILADMMYPHQLNVWRKDKCNVLYGVSLTKHGKTTLVRKLRSIIDTQKLHAEITGPDNYWVKVDLPNGTRFNSFLSSSVLLQMDAKKIQYELMNDNIVQTHIRSQLVKGWWRRAIRKQIKINKDSRMAVSYTHLTLPTKA